MPTFYECQRCTSCCRWPGQVKLVDAEISKIASFLELSEESFIQNYTRLNTARSGLALMDKPNGGCIFLEGDLYCIQAVKPQQCRDFPNLWNFPGFEKSCRSIPIEVDEATYLKRIEEATGRRLEQS